MTPKQKKTLEAIIYLTNQGVFPTYRQLAAHRGLGLGNVHRHVQCLIDGGFVSQVEGRHRTLKVVDRFTPEHLEGLSQAELLSLRGAIDRRLAG